MGPQPARSRIVVMTYPKVTEKRPALEPTAHDPFVDDLTPPRPVAATAPRPATSGAR
jgi:hypothetical protein